MDKILLLADFSEVATGLFNSLSKIFSVQLLPFEWNQIDKSLSEGSAKAIIAFVKVLDHEQSVAFHRVLQHEVYGKIPVVLIGSKDDCKEHVGKWGGNIVKISLTPTTVNTLVQEISELFLEKAPETEINPEENNRKHILVVDDDILFLRTITNNLNKIYKVSSVKSGTAAISFLGSHKPDMILLDYSMPVCDGPQTFQMIKAEENTKDIPIFFLTGMSDENHVKQAMSLKPEGYILKTCASNELINRLEEFFVKH